MNRTFKQSGFYPRLLCLQYRFIDYLKTFLSPMFAKQIIAMPERNSDKGGCTKLDNNKINANKDK